MIRDLASATSETYNMKVPAFKNGKPEDFLQIIKDFKTATDGTGYTPTTGKIQFLSTMLYKEALENSSFQQVKLGEEPMGFSN